jgi:hypothetical protein
MLALLPAFLRSAGDGILQPQASCLGRSSLVEFPVLDNIYTYLESNYWEEEHHRSTGILPDSFLGNNPHKSMGNQNLRVFAFGICLYYASISQPGWFIDNQTLMLQQSVPDMGTVNASNSLWQLVVIQLLGYPT